MSQHFFLLRGSFLLMIILGCFCNKKKGQWTFTFPQSIKVVKHSDVEIPCTFTAPDGYGEADIVWYEYDLVEYPIVYSEDASEVNRAYRDRTSLIPNGTNSCSLRITDVTRTRWYYPGISEDINSYVLSNDETKRAVQVRVPGCSEDQCEGWEFTFPRSIEALRGSCVEIPCKLKYPESVQNFTLFWYRKVFIGYPQIFNSRSSTDVEEKYKGRTFLMGKSMDTCSLRIDDVQEPVEIFPGVNKEINSYNIHTERFSRISVRDSPPAPLVEGTEQMIENKRVNVTCSVNHTCASHPPNITWNRPDLEATISHEDLGRGIWRRSSTIQYIPLHQDDKTQFECVVRFPNNEVSRRSVTLDIKYKPINVTISFADIQPKEGDRVTLQCTSQANPRVTQFTWYKVGTTETITGNHLTVQNGTKGDYICSAGNEIGSRNSSTFSLMTQYGVENKKDKTLIIAAAAGCAALAVIVVVIIFCILMRRKRTSVHAMEKKSPEKVQAPEQITMDNLLYENFDGRAKQSSPRPGKFLHGQNDDGEERDSCQSKITKEEENVENSIVYTSVEMVPANHIPKPSRTIEETEYAQLNM